MRPRHGTKDSQGINGEAIALEKWTEQIARLNIGTAGGPCPYPRHRKTDWLGIDEHGEPLGPVQCGVCHPPASDPATGEPLFPIRRVPPVIVEEVSPD